MCYPLELRFYGTCLEDLGRKDFYVFREDECKANEYSEVLKIRNIHDPIIRSKLIVVLSLLNSSNTICAKELFKVLSEEITIETMENLGILFDMKLLDQYLLVLTLAQHHPAFSFDQQTFLTHLSISLQTYVTELYSREKTKCEETVSQNSFYPGQPLHPCDGFSNASHPYRHTSPRHSDSSFNQVQITNLKVKPPHKKMCVRIRVAWGSNKITDAFKTPHDLLVFHQKLVQLYPVEAKHNNQDKYIPPLPNIIATWNKQSNLSENVITAATEYVQQFNSHVPCYVLESDFVRNFFMPSFPNRAALSRAAHHRGADPGQFDMPPKNSRLRSLTIYNSQISDNSPRHRPESRQKTTPVPSQKEDTKNGSSGCARPSPVNSPLDSPLSSPYASPLNSETNSRAPSPWNIAPPATLERPGICHEAYATEKGQAKDAPEQWDSVRNFKIEELQAMPITELENLGIVKTDRPKMKDLKSPLNGIVGAYIPKNALLLKTASDESSPVCSEYSSPPQSPSPGEPYNQSGSLSSGNEENNEKRIPLKPLNDLCIVEESEPSIQDSPFKRTEDDSVCMKGNMNRNSVSVIPFAVPYSSIITQLPPPQNMKPVYLPIPCRTNNMPQHLSPGAVVFDTQFSRVPLPSALTFLPPGPPPQRTPDRVLPPPAMPISTVSPFPVVTSGCTTVPSASCSITTHRSSNMTAVTNSGASTSRYVSKNQARDNSDMVTKPPSDSIPYATGYILNTSAPLTAVSCSCYTTNSARPSPAPSPSQPPPTAVPVSMSYLGMPYLFHSIPFLQPQGTTNGFGPQPPPGMPNSGQGYSYTLPNGITAISPELIYPGQTFALQSGQSPVATPASQCYGFPQTAAVPIKLVTCYNCGKVGHRGLDCKEQTMDDVAKPGKFQLNFAPVPKMPDSHE
ncbi:hypothetical protein JTE90_022023 [Oedothorax gibbosus]|uniref:CCHC-type domain-containing protein n=1 Tax=Oedothorax gibbosus TaxID=931172 RepID=A0AAV6V1F1_9ARAC|nr:hypothetical protein JTE90_022023 [Oedothorax gibbosus]